MKRSGISQACATRQDHDRRRTRKWEEAKVAMLTYREDRIPRDYLKALAHKLGKY